jgi:hypothetical protein
MKCPDCGSQVRGNFCSSCGRQLPYVVGASFPYGLRFPAPERKGGVRYQAAVNAARNAPRYWEKTVGEVLYHAALYDLHSIRHLVELFGMAGKAFTGREEMIEHTTDGRRFSGGHLPWGCFADRVEGRPGGGMIVPHENVKCFSLWGCHYAQDRQPRHYHVDGKEIFRHGIHGFFRCAPEDEDLFGNYWPDGLRERLERTPFQFRKSKIRDEAMRWIKRYGGHRCPSFSAKYLDAQLAAIPNVLVPADNPLWQVEELPGHWPGVSLLCYQPKAVLNLDQKALLRGQVQLGHDDFT